jgi:hypothetical protein
MILVITDDVVIHYQTGRTLPGDATGSGAHKVLGNLVATVVARCDVEDQQRKLAGNGCI